MLPKTFVRHEVGRVGGEQDVEEVPDQEQRGHREDEPPEPAAQLRRTPATGLHLLVVVAFRIVAADRRRLAHRADLQSGAQAAAVRPCTGTVIRHCGRRVTAALRQRADARRARQRTHSRRSVRWCRTATSGRILATSGQWRRSPDQVGCRSGRPAVEVERLRGVQADHGRATPAGTCAGWPARDHDHRRTRAAPSTPPAGPAAPPASRSSTAPVIVTQHGGAGQRRRRRRARPAAPVVVSPRHQMPSTSSGQNVDAATANASPTASASRSARAEQRQRQRHRDRQQRGDPEPATLRTASACRSRSWASTPATETVSPDDVDRNAANAPAVTSAVSRSPSVPAEHPLRAAAAPPRRCRRRQQVAARRSGRATPYTAGTGRTRRAAPARRASSGGRPGRRGWCRSGPARAAGPWCRRNSGQDQRVRRVERVVPAAAVSGVGHAARRPAADGAGRPVGLPGQQQEEHRHGQRGELQPVLERLHERDRPHAAGSTLTTTTTATSSPPDPRRRAGDVLQRQAGALELRHQVEPADETTSTRAVRRTTRRLQPGLGEVGQRVGARAAQRRGDQHQQHQVAGGVADRRTRACRRRTRGSARRRRGTRPPTGTRRRSRRRSSAG